MLSLMLSLMFLVVPDGFLMFFFLFSGVSFSNAFLLNSKFFLCLSSLVFEVSFFKASFFRSKSFPCLFLFCSVVSFSLFALEYSLILLNLASFFLQLLFASLQMKYLVTLFWRF